jgi:tetratricopeptide (TPR) repeat protein
MDDLNSARMRGKFKIMTSTDKDWYAEVLQLKQKGQHQKAIRAFDRAIDHKMRFAESYFARGICYYKLGNSRQAMDDLDAAALLGCKDAQFWSKHDRNRIQRSDGDKKDKFPTF